MVSGTMWCTSASEFQEKHLLSHLDVFSSVLHTSAVLKDHSSCCVSEMLILPFAVSCIRMSGPCSEKTLVDAWYALSQISMQGCSVFWDRLEVVTPSAFQGWQVRVVFWPRIANLEERCEPFVFSLGWASNLSQSSAFYNHGIYFEKIGTTYEMLSVQHSFKMCMCKLCLHNN